MTGDEQYKIALVWHKEDGTWWAHGYIGPHNDIFTEAETEDELWKNLLDAIRLARSEN